VLERITEEGGDTTRTPLRRYLIDGTVDNSPEYEAERAEGRKRQDARQAELRAEIDTREKAKATEKMEALKTVASEVAAELGAVLRATE